MNDYQFRYVMDGKDQVKQVREKKFGEDQWGEWVNVRRDVPNPKRAKRCKDTPDLFEDMEKNLK